jgi:undecaprenol kinase
MESKHSLFKSFGFAFTGLKTAIVRGRNFKIQLFVGALAVALGVILKLDYAGWLDLVIVISLVLILELINTSLEAIVDLVSPEIRESAKVAKDVAAATVLIASIASVVIGVLLFLPRILRVL